MKENHIFSFPSNHCYVTVYSDATYDAPLQLCAYLGALNSVPEFQGRVRQGMIVVAYENGKPADVYKMNEIMLRKYWRVWLGRLQEFWIRSRDGTLLEPIWGDRCYRPIKFEYIEVIVSVLLKCFVLLRPRNITLGSKIYLVYGILFEDFALKTSIKFTISAREQSFSFYPKYSHC